MDDDGQITLSDYKAYFKAWGLDEAQAEPAFSRLDLSGDGTLSRTSFTLFGSNFYMSDEENVPGNWLFGSYE